jgi:hypothetical protein
MKKFLLLIALVFITITTSGCIKCSYNIEIDKKDNVKFTETQAIDLSLFKSYGGAEVDQLIKQSFDEQSKQFESEGYKVEPFTDDKYNGIKLSKEYKIDSMKNNDLPKGFASKIEKPILVKSGFFNDKYTIHLIYDYSKIMDNTNQQNIAQPNQGLSSAPSQQELQEFNKSMENMFKPQLDLTIKLPQKPKKQNATKVISDTEYQWTLSSSEVTDIFIEYEKFKIMPFIVFGVIFLLLFIMYKTYQNNVNQSNW